MRTSITTKVITITKRQPNEKERENKDENENETNTIIKTLQYSTVQYILVMQCFRVGYIPLISRVRGPYGKLWTEFFPSFYGPSAERAGHENKEGKNEDP